MVAESFLIIINKTIDHFFVLLQLMVIYWPSD